MKKSAFKGGKRLNTLLVSSILASAGLAPTTVMAQSLGIANDEFTIRGSGESSDFLEALEFSSDGLILLDHGDDLIVPFSDGFGIPSFEFDLISENVTPNTSYEFKVYVTFDRQGSQSRLETRIDRLILNVDADGNVTGSIPSTDNGLRVLGRNGSGNFTVELDIANASDNGPVSLSGGTVTFDGNDLVTRIRNSHAQFDSVILAEFDDAAVYDYEIVVEQTQGTPLAFRVLGDNILDGDDDLIPTVGVEDCLDFCNDPTDMFVLNFGEFATGFTDGYTVEGQFIVGSPAPTPTPSPSPSPSASPSPSPSASPSPSPTVAPSASPSPSPGASPSASPSPSPSVAPSASPSPTPSVKTFAIEDNELTITGSGNSNGFVEVVEFDETGVVEHVTDVPTTEGVGIPSFSFNLINNAITAGTYEFHVGVTFDKENSASRIEAYLPRLILTVAGNGNVTGSIPAASNTLRVLARDGSGNIEVDIGLVNQSDNGPVRLNGGTVTFDAEYLIERISDSNDAFSDIILEQFDETASYDYRIVVDQTDSNPAVQFSHYDGIAGFTALPKVRNTCGANCTLNTVAFQLDVHALATYFTEAYTVTGSFNVVPFIEPSPTPEDEGGGGGPSPEDLDDELSDLLDDLEELFEELEFDADGPSDDQLDLLENAFDDLEEQLSNLGDGPLSATAGFSLLNTGGRTFDIGGNAADLGGDFNVGGAAGTLAGFSNVISAMRESSTPLTQNQINDIVDFTESKLESAAKMLSNDTPTADLEKMMEATADLLNSTLDAGGELSEELVAAAVQIALKAVNNIAGNVVSQLGLGEGFDINNQAQVQQLLRDQPVAMSKTINSMPPVRSREPINDGLAKQNLGNSGINAAAADRIIAALGVITNPNGVSLPSGQNATSKLLSALGRAFGGGTVTGVLEGGLNLFSATSFAVNVDPVTGALRVRADAESYAATSTAVRLVPSIVPEGVSYTSDGRAVAVADGVAIELAPAAVDVLGFAAAVERAGFPATFRSNGSLALAMSNNTRFSGSFAYDNIGAIATSCGAISFSDPLGAPNSAGYAFTMHCANGITQRIVPFVDNAAFYTAVGNAGLTISTDRNTGVVTIGTVGRFKPSFFVNPLSTADQSFLTANGNNGFAFRSRDVNGDGRADYEIISTTGVQAMFGMP